MLQCYQLLRQKQLFRKKLQQKQKVNVLFDILDIYVRLSVGLSVGYFYSIFFYKYKTAFSKKLVDLINFLFDILDIYVRLSVGYFYSIFFINIKPLFLKSWLT